MLSDEFCDRISRDWQWRERELRDFDVHLIRPQEVSIKSGLLLTYGHWEGHFKYSASEVLDYISEGIKRKIFRWTDVNSVIRQRILFCSYRRASLSGQTHETFIAYLNALHDARFNSALSARNEIIMIDDNLNSARAEAICRNLGVDYSWFALKKVIIDDRVLEHRNAIAHGSRNLRSGEAINFSDSLLLDSLGEMRALIRGIRDHFENAIALKSFLS